MLSSSAVDLQSRRQEPVHGVAIVIRDRFGQPFALAVETAPGFTEMYCIATNEQSFRDALKQYGVRFEASVSCKQF
jgi:hypothetical protein